MYKMELLGYMALIILGLVLGALGMGGSMLAIPILVYAFSLNMVTASAYALFMIGITSLFGYALKQKHLPTDLRTVVTFGLPSLTASFVTRMWIVEMIASEISFGTIKVEKEHVLLGIFFALMVVSSVLMITRGKRTRRESNERVRFHCLLPAGLVAGSIAGLVGVGGGFLILPSLVIFGRLSVSAAVGTTLILIALNSLVGFCGDLLNSAIQWTFLLQLTGFCLAGLLIGYLAKDAVSRLVNARSFGWIMAAIAVVLMLTEIIG